MPRLKEQEPEEEEEVKYQKQVSFSADNEIFEAVLKNFELNAKEGKYTFIYNSKNPRFYVVKGNLGDRLHLNMSYDRIEKIMTLEVDAVIRNPIESQEVSEIMDFIKHTAQSATFKEFGNMFGLKFKK